MARQTFLTDEMVEAEIRRLTESKYVKLARAEQRMKYRKRQYLYTLRNMEKRGRELEAAGYDIDSIEALAYEEENAENEA